VSLSADGNTLATSGYSDNTFIGATWIYTRSGGIWTQQGSKLVGTGYSGIPRQGMPPFGSLISLILFAMAPFILVYYLYNSGY
jgi:hypothetical protein